MIKKMVAKAIAPVAIGSAKMQSKDVVCLFILHQPKLPSKLMNTVK